MPAALEMSHYVVVSNMSYTIFIIGMRHLMEPNETSLPPLSGFLSFSFSVVNALRPGFIFTSHLRL